LATETLKRPPVPPGKLRLEHVGMVFDNDGKSFSVLEDINLDVSDGEFICLVGPSGCGKSTLLNLIGGFLSQTSGSITIDGQAVHGPDPRRILVFQELGVFPWLTVEGNIGFGLSSCRPRNATNASHTMCKWCACRASSILIPQIFQAA